MNDINCLVVSSTIDYSTDLICYELEKRRKRYARINRDHFSNYDILYSLESDRLSVAIDGKEYGITPKSLESVYFRAPVFLRTGKEYSLQQQLSRSQWSAFIRNLIVFDKAKWINHPVATYQAENKLFQLKCAKRLGLAIPTTFVGNTLPEHLDVDNYYIVKSLDTALFYENGQELFTYSTMISGSELLQSEIRAAPIIIQKCLRGKMDLRVTVVENEVFAASITKDGQKIEGDWRKNPKEELTYNRVEIPSDIKRKVLELMHCLGLTFGGVDLAFVDGTYYFIEVNPTGEWGWLVSSAHLSIDKAIVNSLVGGATE